MDARKGPVVIWWHDNISMKGIQAEIKLDAYLDALLSHLKRDGPARHTHDVPPQSPEELWQYQVADVFGGAVKGLMSSPGFVPFADVDFHTLKSLVALAWGTDDVDKFRSSCEARGVDIAWLTPEAADLVVVAACCRRHAWLFAHLVDTLEPPPTTSFDRLRTAAVKQRVTNAVAHQHSYRSPASLDTEARLWTQLLGSRWVHDPVDGNLARCLTNVERDNWAHDYNSPTLLALHDVLAARGLNPGDRALRCYLELCRDPVLAERYVRLFGKGLGTINALGNILVDIVEHGRIDEATRITLLRIVLEHVEGLDINGVISRPWLDDMRAFGQKPQPGDMFNALHAAAWTGNLESAKLLVQAGADPTVEDRELKKTAEQLARERGHTRWQTIWQWPR